jgi:hypothetical protein
VVDFYEIQQGGQALDGDLDAMLFDFVPLTTPNWRAYNF